MTTRNRILYNAVKTVMSVAIFMLLRLLVILIGVLVFGQLWSYIGLVPAGLLATVFVFSGISATGGWQWQLEGKP